MANRTYTYGQRQIIKRYRSALKEAADLERILATAREVGHELYIERLEAHLAELEDEGELLIDQAVDADLDPEDLA